MAAEDVDENGKGAFIFDLGEEDKEREQRYIGAVNGKSLKVFITGGITALFSSEKEARSHRFSRSRRTLKPPQLLACITARHSRPQDVGAQLGRDRQEEAEVAGRSQDGPRDRLQGLRQQLTPVTGTAGGPTSSGTPAANSNW